MKKSVLLIGPFLFSMALGGGTKYLVPEKPVVKTVRFSVFTDDNYSKPLYRHSKAKVLLSIWKFTDNSQELVWSTIVDAGKLKNYPGRENSLFREVTIHNIKEHKETLIASYKVIYDSKGAELYYDKGYIVSEGVKPSEFNIPI